MILALLVGLAAGVGALARYLVDGVIQHRHDSAFPFGTLIVNLSGSLGLGLLTGLATRHGLPTGPAVVLSAGFCSGYTTWSTFSYETLALAEAGTLLLAAANVITSLAAGLAAVVVGVALVSW